MQIKRAVRAALPGFRLSITLRNDFYVRVGLLAGPVAAGRKETIRSGGHVADLKGRPELAKVFRTITRTIKAAKSPRIVHRFHSGGHAMNYEIELTVGSHHRDYRQAVSC